MERLREAWIPPVVIDHSPRVILPEKDDGSPFLLETEMVLGKLEPAAQDLFGELFETPEFDRALDLIKKQRPWCRPGSTNLRRLRAEAGGYMFSLLCCILLREEQRQKGIKVVSPRDTETIFGHLYPGRRQSNPRGWGLMIDGITTPDGVLVEYTVSNKATIGGVCEYTLRRPDDPVKEKQRAHYQNPDFIIEDFFPSRGLKKYGVRLSEGIRRKFNYWGTLQVADRENFKVIHVYPRQECQETKKELQSSESERFAPLTGEEFHEVMDAIFTDVESVLV